MADETITHHRHSCSRRIPAPSVEVDSFNIELKDEEGFLGDRASKAPSGTSSTDGEAALRKIGADLSARSHRRTLARRCWTTSWCNDTEGSGESFTARSKSFAQELAYVTRRFLKTKAWRKHGAHRCGRRLSRQPARRTRHRPHTKTS